MADTLIFVRLNYSGSTPTGFAEYQNGETAVLPGNLNISGNSRRITADFNSADPTAFQEQTANNRTLVYAAPSGTATEAGYVVRNAAALTNCTIGVLRVNATTVSVESNVVGGGTPLPLSLMTAGVIRMQLGAANADVTFPATAARIKGDFYSGTGLFANRLIFQSSSGFQTKLTCVPPSGSTACGYQAFSNPTDLENSARATISIETDGITHITSDRTGSAAYQPMVFETGGSERVRIDTSGGYYVGTTSSDPIGTQVAGLYRGTNGVVSMYGTGAATLRLGVASGTQTLAAFLSNGATVVGTISTNGTTTTYNTSSDYRLKDDVQPLDAGEATDRIMAYRPVTWTWKSDGTVGKGFIAHECQAVDPMTATGTKDEVERIGNVVLPDGTIEAQGVGEPADLSGYAEGAEWQLTAVRPVYQGRDDSKMIPDLIAMVQRMETRIRQLEAQLAAVTPS